MMLHLHRILALTFYSKFQLIQDWCFWKEIQLYTTFSEIKKTKFQRFPSQKCVSNCCWNSNVFFLAFLKFSTGCVYFSIQFIFQKKKILLKLREGISLLDKLEQIWCWSPFEILKENWSWCWICVIFCTCFVFWL